MRSNLLSLWKAFDHQIDNFKDETQIFRPWVSVPEMHWWFASCPSCSFTSEMGICYSHPCFRNPQIVMASVHTLLFPLAPREHLLLENECPVMMVFSANVSETIFHYHCHPNCVATFVWKSHPSSLFRLPVTFCRCAFLLPTFSLWEIRITAFPCPSVCV